LPYLDLAGAPNGYATLKPDRPRPGRKAGKPHKYELPKGGGNRTYIPPGVGPLLADPTKPLLITEGVKKALKATQEGLPTVALSGGWNGKVKSLRELIADLKAIAWAGRRVDLAFDSDAASNDSVQKAEAALREMLSAEGADVRVARIPGRPDGTKVGLDDYLLEHTADDLRRLLELSPVLLLRYTPSGPGRT